MTAASGASPLPAGQMLAVNAIALDALRKAAAEHSACAHQLHQAALSLTVRDPLRGVYLSCASRLFVMAKLARTLGETLQDCSDALDLPASTFEGLS